MVKIMLNGYYLESTCKAIQKEMEGQTWLEFHVEYEFESVGDPLPYGLCVSTSILGVTVEELREKVTSYLVRELAKPRLRMTDDTYRHARNGFSTLV